MSVKLACINIERSKHLGRVQAFLKAQKPNILCLQELCERDIPLFEDMFGQPMLYAPMVLHPAEEEPHPMGVGIIATSAVEYPEIEEYIQKYPIQEIEFNTQNGDFNVNPETIKKVLVGVSFNGLRITSTHFTWTQNGESTPLQLSDADKLLHAVHAQEKKYGNVVLCGDFNAPRGRPTFTKIAQQYADAIPQEYETSLDLSLHRTASNPEIAARISKYMVDGLFHSSNIKAENVVLHTGVSDHKAITANLNRS